MNCIENLITITETLLGIKDAIRCSNEANGKIITKSPKENKLTLPQIPPEEVL